MFRALSVVLAACCVLSMGIAGLPAADSPSAAAPSQSATCSNDDPHVVCLPNTSNYLAPNGSEVVAASVNESSLDVSSAVATDVSSLTTRLSMNTMETAYRNTPPKARQALLERYNDALANRTADLRARERRALRDYNDGDLTGREYLRTLAEIDATADRLWELSTFVKDRWSSATGQYRRDPSAATRADLSGLRSPIRDGLQAAYAGERDSFRVYVTTTDSGVVLSGFTTADGQRAFVSDTYLGSVRRSSSGDDRYGGNPARAFQRMTELYPWLFSDKTEGIGGASGVYWATGFHGNFGTARVFLDGQSGLIFAEHRQAYVDRLPFRYTNNTNGSLTVTLGQTRRGGPLNVTVTDASGERVPATVTVRRANGRRWVAETGDDGSLWTVTPYTPSFVVKAEYEGETVTIVRFARTQGS